MRFLVVGLGSMGRRRIRDLKKLGHETVGYDIYTLEGNIGFGKYLYKNYGLNPWGASFNCWKYLD